MKQKNRFLGILCLVRKIDASEEKKAKKKDTPPNELEHPYAGEYIMAGLLMLVFLVSLILKLLHFI